MTSIVFIVPGQPQGKGRPRVGKIGGHARMFTPEKTVAYEGLNGVAWRDDVQVVQVTKRKRYAPLPGVYVEITTVEGAA